MDKILITGAGGYIGSIATAIFLKEGFEVVAIDNFSTGYKEPLELLQKQFGKQRLRIYKKDITSDLSIIFKREKGLKIVVHFAACCSVDESMKNPKQYFTNNICGSQNLLSTMIDFDVKSIVFSSTCAVYGEALYVPVDELHPFKPSNPYGQSKKIVEEIIEWYGKQCGLNFVILRYFNVCGALEDGSIGDSKKPSPLLVQNCVRGALKISDFNLTCSAVPTKDQTPIRDYINVVDLAYAHVKSVRHLLQGNKSDIFNLGTGKGNSVCEIINKVGQITNTKIDFKKGIAREGEYAVMIASIKKAKKTLKWRPSKTLSDSVNSLVLWYKTHPNGWKY